MQIVTNNPIIPRETTSAKSLEEVVNASGVSEDPAKLIDWHVGVLREILKKIWARRAATFDFDSLEEVVPKSNGLVVDEVTEVIHLPEASDENHRHEDVELSPIVESQLHEFVSSICELYHDNPFHNFQHASRVTKSLEIFLTKIADSSEPHVDNYTYRLTSDPVTQFACIFAALIHDVDHAGVPNSRLVQEDAEVAKTYNNKSVAEQNSVDVAWNLLMSDRFMELRSVIYATEKELKHFRQIVVNAVMATDIMDKELKELRNMRWSKAFEDSEVMASCPHNTNRKVTSIIEILLQASDVAHTMHNWEVFREWNQCLFEEMSNAYEKGRADANPADNWYKSEIGFFDFYIIPLAKKLQESGVFGESGDEFLQNAQNNRDRWEREGQEIVVKMVVHRLRSRALRNESLSPSAAA